MSEGRPNRSLSVEWSVIRIWWTVRVLEVFRQYILRNRRKFLFSRYCWWNFQKLSSGESSSAAFIISVLLNIFEGVVVENAFFIHLIVSPLTSPLSHDNFCNFQINPYHSKNYSKKDYITFFVLGFFLSFPLLFLLLHNVSVYLFSLSIQI